MVWNFFIISWVQWDYWDVSFNMLKYIKLSDLLFVEEIDIFNKFNIENKILFSWNLIELNSNFVLTDYKKEIIKYLLSWKNVWIFESSGCACFIDPWYEIIDYIYTLRSKIDFNIIPIPWTSALTLAISCSWFNIVDFKFLWFINKNSNVDILTSNIPVIYFNQISDIISLKDSISFMLEIENRSAFVWVNLWKIWVNNSNILIRWTYREVYETLNKLYTESSKIDDLTFIFN